MCHTVLWILENILVGEKNPCFRGMDVVEKRSKEDR